MLGQFVKVCTVLLVSIPRVVRSNRVVLGRTLAEKSTCAVPTSLPGGGRLAMLDMAGDPQPESETPQQVKEGVQMEIVCPPNTALPIGHERVFCRQGVLGPLLPCLASCKSLPKVSAGKAKTVRHKGAGQKSVLMMTAEELERAKGIRWFEGDYLEYVCESGSKFAAGAPNVMQCSGEGTWSAVRSEEQKPSVWSPKHPNTLAEARNDIGEGRVECLSHCPEIVLGEHVAIKQTVPRDNARMWEGFAGDGVVIGCEENYVGTRDGEQIDEFSLTCDGTGKWVEDADPRRSHPSFKDRKLVDLTCSAVCKIPTAPKYGTVSPPEHDTVWVGEAVKFGCNQNRVLLGAGPDGFSTCMESHKLKYSMPSCMESAKLQFGSLSLRGMDLEDVEAIKIKMFPISKARRNMNLQKDVVRKFKKDIKDSDRRSTLSLGFETELSFRSSEKELRTFLHVELCKKKKGKVHRSMCKSLGVTTVPESQTNNRCTQCVTSLLEQVAHLGMGPTGVQLELPLEATSAQGDAKSSSAVVKLSMRVSFT